MTTYANEGVRGLCLAVLLVVLFKKPVNFSSTPSMVCPKTYCWKFNVVWLSRCNLYVESPLPGMNIVIGGTSVLQRQGILWVWGTLHEEACRSTSPSSTCSRLYCSPRMPRSQQLLHQCSEQERLIGYHLDYERRLLDEPYHTSQPGANRHRFPSRPSLCQTSKQYSNSLQHLLKNSLRKALCWDFVDAWPREC